MSRRTALRQAVQLAMAGVVVDYEAGLRLSPRRRAALLIIANEMEGERMSAMMGGLT